MDFSIIIPTYKRENILLKTLQFLQRASADYNAEIIIVNDSDDDILIPGELLINSIIIKNHHKGVASARNCGAYYARGKWLIFMDDDILTSKENFSKVILFIQTHENERACLNLNWKYPIDMLKRMNETQFGRYLNAYGFDSLEGRGWLNHMYQDRNRLHVIENAASFFLVIKKSLFDQIGGYTETFSFSGFEDYDFAKKLLTNNIKCYILPSSLVFHNESDRLDVYQWMARRYRAGITRRQAVNIGHLNLRLNNNFNLKFLIYKFLVILKPILYKILNMIPNNIIFDRFYFKLTNILLGISIFDGYNSKLK